MDPFLSRRGYFDLQSLLALNRPASAAEVTFRLIHGAATLEMTAGRRKRHCPLDCLPITLGTDWGTLVKRRSRGNDGHVCDDKLGQLSLCRRRVDAAPEPRVGVVETDDRACRGFDVSTLSPTLRSKSKKLDHSVIS